MSLFPVYLRMESFPDSEKVIAMQAMPTPKARILYSEDDPDSREIMCLVLNREGFETICPDTSEDVLRIAKAEKFDAYLLDTWTPGISGVEICKRIRELDSHTPIIFYSGAAYETDKEAARAAGAQAYITKPAPVEEVVDALRSAISTPGLSPPLLRQLFD